MRETAGEARTRTAPLTRVKASVDLAAAPDCFGGHISCLGSGAFTIRLLEKEVCVATLLPEISGQGHPWVLFLAASAVSPCIAHPHTPTHLLLLLKLTFIRLEFLQLNRRDHRCFPFASADVGEWASVHMAQETSLLTEVTAD
ncbi:unnamed protein product [Pleuronectes platessa]|uniref:Uncharacterized protein n=1 Tax=Pleuronectes platessa TaxID=8262 RepID=A0A9N7V8P1_PLEPL|nr:unnamed protein product [Pleuronectes platessa]